MVSKLIKMVLVEDFCHLKTTAAPCQLAKSSERYGQASNVEAGDKMCTVKIHDIIFLRASANSIDFIVSKLLYINCKQPKTRNPFTVRKQ